MEEWRIKIEKMELREVSRRGFNGWFIGIPTLNNEVLGLGLGLPLVPAA